MNPEQSSYSTTQDLIRTEGGLYIAGNLESAKRARREADAIAEYLGVPASDVESSGFAEAMNDPQRIREMAMGRYAIGYSAGSLPFEGVTVAGWTAIAPPTPKSKTELVARAALLPLTLQGRAIGNAERSKRAASLLLDQGRELTTNGWGHLKHLPDISKYSAYEDLRERSERTPGHVGVMTQDGFGFYLTPKQVTDLERRGTQVVSIAA